MTRNSIGFAHKKAQTISFVERGFERLGLGHQAVSLFVVFIHGSVIFALGIFLLEAGWEALVFGHFSQPPLWRTHLYIIWSSLIDLSPPLVGLGRCLLLYPSHQLSPLTFF